MRYVVDMRVVFAALGQEQLGISMLSSVLRRAGHDTSLVFEPALFHDRYYFDVPVLRDLFDRGDRIVDEIEAERPDLLAFSVLTPMYQWSLDVARKAKARLGVPVIFGGVHPSAVPEVCLENDCVDYVCVGEGERTIVELCDALESNGGRRPGKPIDNLWFRADDGSLVRGRGAGFDQDLDSLPYWDKELWEPFVDLRENYQTMTARGCAYRCTFCFNNFWVNLPDDRKAAGKYVRQRSVGNVIAELVQMKRRYRFKRVEFHDDIFTLKRAWLREFLEEYRRDIGVPFTCLAHPRFMDREMASWLKEAGCDRVQMGIQSADPEYRRTQLLRMEKDVDLSRALEAMTSAGLVMKLDHLLGLPGEPRGALEDARALYARFTPARVNTYWLTYLPGTEILTNALAEGRLTQAQVDEINRGNGRFFHHLGEDRPDDHQLYAKYDLLFRAMPLLPPALRERLRTEHLPDLPQSVFQLLGFLFDLVASMAQADPEVWVYAKHYATQLRRVVPEMLGMPVARPKRRPPPPKPERPRKPLRALTVVES